MQEVDIQMFKAVRSNNMEDLIKAIGNGCNINGTDPDFVDITPLIIACQHGYLDIARLLLDSGANIDLKCNEGCTPLFNACANNHTNIVRLLVERGADINLGNITMEENPLSISIDNKNIPIIKILINQPTINLNQIENLYCPYLFQAIVWDNFEIMDLLLNAGADVNIVDNNGETPIEFAIKDNKFEIIQELLLHGANIPEYLDYENIYDDEIIELLKMWPGLMILYGLKNLGTLDSINADNISSIIEYFN